MIDVTFHVVLVWFISFVYLFWNKKVVDCWLSCPCLILNWRNIFRSYFRSNNNKCRSIWYCCKTGHRCSSERFQRHGICLRPDQLGQNFYNDGQWQRSWNYPSDGHANFQCYWFYRPRIFVTVIWCFFSINILKIAIYVTICKLKLNVTEFRQTLYYSYLMILLNFKSWS